MENKWNIYDQLRGKFEVHDAKNLIAVTGAINILVNNRQRYNLELDYNWKDIIRDKSLLLKSIEEIYKQNNIEIFNDETVRGSINKLSIEEYSQLIDFINSISINKDIVKFCEDIIVTSSEEAQYSGYKYHTPDNIFEIPLCLFGIKEGSTIVNYFNGESSLLIDIINNIKKDKQSNEIPEIDYYGQDLETEVFKVGQLVSYLIMNDTNNIRHGDSISNPLFIENKSLCKFDYSISIPPFSMSINDKEIINDKFDRFSYGIPKRVGVNSDWIVIQHILDSIKSKGKGAVLLPLGALYRTGGEAIIRREIVKDDVIDTIIKLPAGIFTYTGIATCWIIFDKDKPLERKNKIQFIDLSEYTVDINRRFKTVSSEGVNLTTKLYKNNKENEISNFVNLEKIEEYDFDLNAFAFIELERLYSKFDSVEMIELSKIAKIRRGVQISKAKLDSINTVEDRNHYLISLGNIDPQGNIILEESDKIKAEERWIDLYQAEKGDILVTSRGSLFKVAIIDENIENAIVSSNLFLIRTNKDKYKPEILKYFFDSEIGKQLINSITKGSIISSISSKDLDKFLIPNIDINVQEDANKLISNNKKKYIDSIREAETEYEVGKKKVNELLNLNVKNI